MAREWNRVPQLSLFCLLVLPLGRRRSTVLRGMPTPHTLFGQGLGSSCCGKHLRALPSSLPPAADGSRLEPARKRVVSGTVVGPAHFTRDDWPQKAQNSQKGGILDMPRSSRRQGTDPSRCPALPFCGFCAFCGHLCSSPRTRMSGVRSVSLRAFSTPLLAELLGFPGPRLAEGKYMARAPSIVHRHRRPSSSTNPSSFGYTASTTIVPSG